MRKVVGRLVAILLVLAVLAGAGWAFLHRQDISDHFAAQSFTPSQEISGLTGRLSLTDAGERIFFATHPTLDASQRFNTQCSDVDHSEGGHILGCYTRERIHLFKVTDDRLSGIVEVTAAHELLHAAFSRLSDRERTELAASLTELYEELVATHPELEERMSVYRELSPEGFGNELHSVLGTEVRELPAWLEQHYATWFSDRGSIVDHFEAYHGVFTELQERADRLQEEMAALREDVERRSEAYDAGVERFNADVDDFNRRNEAFEFSDDEAEFWRLRNDLRERAEKLNQEHDAIQADIERYERMREEMEKLNATNEELNQHLNSNLAPPANPATT